MYEKQNPLSRSFYYKDSARVTTEFTSRSFSKDWTLFSLLCICDSRKAKKSILNRQTKTLELCCHRKLKWTLGPKNESSSLKLYASTAAISNWEDFNQEAVGASWCLNQHFHRSSRYAAEGLTFFFGERN